MPTAVSLFTSSCRVAAWAWVVASTACSRGEGQAGTVSLGASERTAPALASTTAFDLAVAASGAVLAWVESGLPSVSFVRFDAEGDLSGRRVRDSVLEPSASIGDLTLSDTTTGPVVLWLQGRPSRVEARAAWLEGTEPVLELGAGWGASTARGNVALAARGEGALAVVRGEASPCEEGSSGSCFEFRSYRLDRATAVEAGINLTVPVPCEEQSVQLISERGAEGQRAEPRFAYAVCTTSAEAPILTVFSIQPERQYAMAERIFEGCTPLGAARFAGQASFVAACGPRRRMASVQEGDLPLRAHDLDERGLICSGGGARLKLGAAWLRLTEPIARLELVLDGELAPPGARAVWTGRALLVASAEAGRLQLAKYVCNGAELRRLANPLTEG